MLLGNDNKQKREMYNMQPKRVLVVDDEANVTLTLAAGLERLGDEYIVDTASNGDEALTKLKQTDYSLLITDYKMPGMSGIDLAETVRETSPDTQLMLMTAYGSAALRDAAEHLGVDAFIDKPFTMAQIREMVANAMAGQAEDSDPERVRRILIMEDNDNLRNLYRRALRREGYEVQTAATLQEARDILAQYDFDAFLCDIHMGEGLGTDLLSEQGDALRKGHTDHHRVCRSRILSHHRGDGGRILFRKAGCPCSPGDVGGPADGSTIIRGTQTQQAHNKHTTLMVRDTFS